MSALPPRDFEQDAQEGVDAYDAAFYKRFGRYPDESPLSAPTASTRRREAIQALIDRGATEGEREAAKSALHRLEHPSAQAHNLTEQGSYYARDTLGGTE